MAEVIELEIVTPFGITYSESVRSCVLPGGNGQFQVLHQHAPLISLIHIGAIKVTDQNGTIQYLATSGGYCEIKDNKVRVIVESAEPAASINTERAIAARKRAEERISKKGPDVDIQRAQMALRRALNRIKITQIKD